MKLAFNPSNSNKNILELIKNNKDIIFDLKGHNIYSRGVEFKGTDTNTWRDIKINNVSIGSNILDLQNGSNTTLINTDGVVTINSTWRPVVDNLTSDSITSSLSANQGRVLAGLINNKSDSDHNHDDLYLKLTGGNLTGNLTGISAMFCGRFYGSGDDEGIIINPASNNFAGLILGTPTGERSVFYYKLGNAFWRYANGSGTMDIYHPKKSGTIALTSDIPTSLKNPYALTISLNGTSQGPYDGSAVKNINITPSSIGAANSEHNHDGRYVYNYGNIEVTGSSVNENALFMTTTSGITGDWWHILQAAWNGEYRWNSQIAFPTQNRNGMYYRSGLYDNTAWGSWVKLLDANNYSSILDSRYYTESEVNSLLSNKLNTSDFNWTNLPGKLVAGNEFNIINAGFKESIYFNYLPINDRSKTATILGYHFGNGAKGHAPITASGFIKTGSGNSYVLLGDGGHQAISSLSVNYANSAGSTSNLTVNQYLSATDTTWFPIIWGGNTHNNTNNSTGAVYKSYDVLSWQNSSQTLYATNLQTRRLETLDNHYYRFNSDATLRIYGTAEGNLERVYFQAGIDNRIDDYDISSYGGEQRHSIILNPRGGFVGIGDSNPAYKLSVGGSIGTVGNIYINHSTNNNMNYNTSNPRIVFSENGNQAVGLVYTDYNSYRASKGLKVMDVDNSDTDNVWFEVQGYNYSSGYVKNGSNDNYVLLGGGGHRAESALSVSNADTVDGVHLEWSGELGANDYTYLAGWASDGKKIKAVNKNQFATHSHSHNYAANENYGGFTKSERLPISGFYQSNESERGGNAPWSNWMHLINCQHNNTTNNYALQIAASFFDNNIFKIRVTKNSVNNTWRDIIHSGNIGSQSVHYANSAGTADSANKLNKWFDSRVTTLNHQFGDGALRIFHATSSVKDTTKCPSDATILHLAWDNNEGWDSQLAVGPSQNKLYFRGQNNYKWNRWQTVLHDGNSSISGNTIKINNTSLTVANSNHNHDNVYLKLAGGTMQNQSRIGVNGDLYIGDADNKGWLYFQDIASQDGTDYWTISTNGSAEFEDISTRSDVNVGGQISRGGISSLWNKGRDDALLRDTSSSGYHPLWSLKTTSGSWDFGEFNQTGWNDIPVLSYITDTQYNGSSPAATYQIKFPLASGTVALTSNIPNPTNYYWANIKVSASSNTQTQPSVNTIYASNWFRSQGASGWYSENYEGGIYMTDSSWVKVFNNKGFYTKNTIKGTKLQVEGTNQTVTVANMEPNLLLLGSDTINNKLDTYIRGLGVYIQSRFNGITDNTVYVKNGNVGIGESPSTNESGKGSLTISNFTFMKCGGTMFRQPVCVFIGNFHHQRSSKYLKASNTNIEFSYSNGIYKFIFKFLPNSKFTTEDLFLQVTGYSELSSQQLTDARGYLINGASSYVEAYIGASDDTSYNTASFYFTIYRYYGSSKKTI